MPVHVYGNPCDIEAIQEIADRYGLAVIYDAAHAFNVKVNGRTILDAGDMNTLSFHATKTYNTVEGGALICHDARTKKRIDYLKNFGFAGETTVVAPGINSKMDEIRSAYGLCNLKHIDNAIAARKKVAQKYRAALSNVPGISMFKERDDVTYNYSYFPIFVNEAEYGTHVLEEYADQLSETGKAKLTSYLNENIQPGATFQRLPQICIALVEPAGIGTACFRKHGVWYCRHRTVIRSPTAVSRI